MRLSSMARQRVITLLGLTSLVAMMVTISRYSSTFSQPTGVRLMITQQKLYEYQQRLRLIASEQNSNKTLNNLLENFIQTKADITPVLQNEDKVEPPVVVPKAVSPISPSSSSLSSSSSSPQPPVQSDNDHDSFVPINNSNNNQENSQEPVIELKPSVDYDPKAPTSGSKTPATERPAKIGSNFQQKAVDSSKQSSAQNNVIPLVKTSVDTNNRSIDPSIDVDADQKSVQNNEKLQQLDNLENNENQLMITKIKPKLVFDREDLKTTESMKIDKPLGCDEDMGASLDLLVIVNSAVNHWEARSAVRQTWGRFAVERGATLFFLIGSTTDPSFQRRVEIEEEHNGDILQGHFIDNYFNLTLKTISMMKWISDRCSKVKYVLKVDDDMFVNMQHITDFTETRFFNKCIIGKIFIEKLELDNLKICSCES